MIGKVYYRVVYGDRMGLFDGEMSREYWANDEREAERMFYKENSVQYFEVFDIYPVVIWES